MNPIYPHDQIIARLRRAREISDRVNKSIMDRARKASVEAGCGEMLGTTLHNALISFEEGKPWREVDYSKARLARRLIKQSYKASEICDRFYKRMVGL